jgi:hypothetical protein
MIDNRRARSTRRRRFQQRKGIQSFNDYMGRPRFESRF